VAQDPGNDVVDELNINLIVGTNDRMDKGEQFLLPEKRFLRLVSFSGTSVIETSLDAPRRLVIFVLRPRKKIFSKVSENYKREI